MFKLLALVQITVALVVAAAGLPLVGVSMLPLVGLYVALDGDRDEE